MSTLTPAAIFASATRQVITKYVNVANFIILVVDYLGTLQSEIRLMWSAKWSAAKVLFFLTRYLALIDVPTGIYYHTALGIPPSTCKTLFSTYSTSFLAGVAIAEAILFLRVFALSGRNRNLGIYLVLQFLAVHVAEFVVFFKFLGGLEYGPSLLPNVIGCMPLPPRSKDANTLLSILFGLILANELSVMIMSLVIGLMKYNNMRSPLVMIFYRDGFFYFLILSAISAGNITADLVGPPEYRFLIVLCQRVMHSVLSGRMILQLRDFAQEPSAVTGAQTFSEVQFNPRIRVQPRQGTAVQTWDSYFPGSHPEDIPIEVLPKKKSRPW